MRSTFKTLFYLKKNSPKPDGTVSLMGRITIDGTISQFSCKMTVQPNICRHIFFSQYLLICRINISKQ